MFDVREDGIYLEMSLGGNVLDLVDCRVTPEVKVVDLSTI